METFRGETLIMKILILWQTGGKRRQAFPCDCYRADGEGMLMQKSVECNKKNVVNSRITAALAYLGILAVVLFFVEKKSSFVRYHVGQGMNLFVLEIVYGIIYQFLAAAVLMISWRLYFLVKLIGAVALVFPALAVIGIINAVNGQEKELPVIGKIRFFR